MESREHTVPYGPVFTPEREPPAPLQEQRPPWRRGLGLLGALGLVLLKFGAKLKALLILLPKVKIFTTSATMLVSVGAYALIWGWRFGLGFVLLLLVHELGHVIQLRREGIKAGAPMFIPFRGALAALSPWVWFVGYGLLVAATVAFPNPVMLLVLLFGGLETWRRWQARKTPEARQFHRVRPATRAAVAAVYLGLAAALAVGMDATFLERDFGDV